VIDISNPVSPTRVGGCVTSGLAWGVSAYRDYAYVADLDAGLQVIYNSYPASPTRVGGYDTSGYAEDVAISGNYAYVADLDSGLQVINISNPASPTLVGGYDTNGYAEGVAVSGNYAYVADGDAGLQMIDISNPASPTGVGAYDTSGYAYDVAVSGNYAYVADNEGGIVVLRMDIPSQAVTSITPNAGSNTGTVSITDLLGTGFQAGATVKLTRSGQNDIAATSVNVVSGSKITCSFDLAGKAPGQWNVVVTNPNAQSAMLANGFTVAVDTAPIINWVAASPALVAGGDSVHVAVSATDDVGVTSVTANGTVLAYLGSSVWSGDIVADPTLGLHTIAVVARDAANNSGTDSSQSYKTARVVGITNRGLVRDITSTAAGNFLFMAWGWVTRLDADTFELDDGSGTPVRVAASGHGLQTDDFAFARGIWSVTASPHVLISSKAHITRR
jgi:hypothetical protein